MVIKQYSIYWCNLNPSIGSEINKARPCLVISPNEMNRNINTIIIAPITKTINAYPTRISIQLEGKNGAIVLDQLITLDKSRFKGYINKLNNKQILAVKAKIKEMLVD